ncbi:MAG: hypothetical protein KatS3mg115_0100 [Candidatus Poribacteria bacterium]|nr:MAG: hypothetical protein KatS3mg115_0100 [Candidatus Poribacteria bacterium]
MIICGAGHVGKAVSELAAFCDFHVTVIDDRPEFANAENLPAANRILVEDIPSALRRLPIDPMTFVVIVTRGHQHDEACPPRSYRVGGGGTSG